MRTRLAALVVVLPIILTACSSSGGTGGPGGSVGPGGSAGPVGSGSPGGITLAAAQVPRASASAADATAAASAINAFGLDLYRQVGAKGGNLVVSPTSIAIALAMARAGARGETANQMDAVLRSVGSDAQAAGINALDAALAGRSGSFPDPEGNDLAVTLRIANAPFAQRGMTLVPAYLDALASRFGAGLRLVDYASDPETARGLINGWVKEQTEARIPELLAPGVLDTTTRLTLVNAIYLKAPWAEPFDASSTEAGPFTRADGSQVDVPMMSLSASLPYAEGSGWRAVDLPYLGGSLALTVIVPDDLASFEASLSAEQLASITGSLKDQPIDLGLPKFGIETKADLAETLSALGMPLAFDRNRADFSGITAEEALYIGAVVHQANITVDEKGTEAAAATAVVMRATAALASPVTLRVDRPFLFALRDLPTGAVLFLGRVADPSAAN